jgi:SAM-dependent methyltransferase
MTFQMKTRKILGNLSHASKEDNLVANIRFSQEFQNIICCPKCHSKVELLEDRFCCSNINCSGQFPIIGGVPVFIDDQKSVFSINDFVVDYEKMNINNHQNFFKKNILNSITPSIGRNIKGKKNYQNFCDELLKQNNYPRVLVIGGKILGQGMEEIINNKQIDFFETDVSFGPRTILICDAHDLPFFDEVFDGVIIQAVLEHVLDPYRCTEEIFRVLNSHGIVYAETPFMQQVHEGRYDFNRFTSLGHRRLFRKFDEIDSGAVCGPGMALAWSYQYFLLSFTKSRKMRSFLRIFSRFTSFYLKYFDYYLIDKPGSQDAASGLYFLGQKGENILQDKELITLYKGAF